MQEIYAPMRAMHTDLVAISPQDVQNSKETIDQLKLEYPVASDAANAVAALYGLKYAFPDYAQEAYKAIGADLAQYNAKEPWTLPVPALFIIGRDGVVQLVSVDSDYRNRIEPQLVLDALQAM